MRSEHAQNEIAKKDLFTFFFFLLFLCTTLQVCVCQCVFPLGCVGQMLLIWNIIIVSHWLDAETCD